MNWDITVQIAALVILYIGGIVAIGRYMTNTIITTLGKRIDDLRAQMTSDHAGLQTDVRKLRQMFITHIGNHDKSKQNNT